MSNDEEKNWTVLRIMDGAALTMLEHVTKATADYYLTGLCTQMKGEWAYNPNLNTVSSQTSVFIAVKIPSMRKIFGGV